MPGKWKTRFLDERNLRYRDLREADRLRDEDRFKAQEHAIKLATDVQRDRSEWIKWLIGLAVMSALSLLASGIAILMVFLRKG